MQNLTTAFKKKLNTNLKFHLATGLRIFKSLGWGITGQIPQVKREHLKVGAAIPQLGEGIR